MLDRTQFHALGQAHASEGGGPVYITAVPDYQLDLPWGEENGCYEIDFGDPQTYFSEEPRAYMWVESLIVPISGKWGVLIAENVHAVVAGSRHFVDAVLSNTTLDADEMALISVRRWKEFAEIGLPSPWLPSLLETMYGSDKAARLAAD
jgi:hypothetical protein